MLVKQCYFKYLLTHRLFYIIQAQGINLRGDRRFPSRVSSRAWEEEEEGEKVSCVRVVFGGLAISLSDTEKGGFKGKRERERERGITQEEREGGGERPTTATKQNQNWNNFNPDPPSVIDKILLSFA